MTTQMHTSRRVWAIFFAWVMTCLICIHAEAMQIKVASLTPDGHQATEDLRKALAEISRATGNDVTFSLYAGGVAGDEMDVIRKMRSNRIHMSSFTGVGVDTIAPPVRVVESPRLFRNYDEVDHVRNFMFDEFKAEFDRQGFVLLGWMDIGFVYLFSKYDLLAADNLSKFKMWVWKGDPTQASYFNDLGFNTVPLHIADVVTGLETGMIDTCFGPPVAATAFQWYSRLKYMLDFPITNGMFVMLINKRTFNELSEKTRGIMIEQFQKNALEGNRLIRQFNDDSLQILKKAGVKVLTPSEKQIAYYEQRALVTIDNAIKRGLFSRDQYERIRKLIQNFREDRNRANP